MKIVRSLFLTLSTLAFAQHPQAQGSLRAAGAFVALSVADLEKSVQWYSEKLGLGVVMRVPKKDGVAVAVLEGGGLIVELVENEDAKPLSKLAERSSEPVRVHGPFKAGAVVEDFEKTLAMLRERGVEIAYGPYPARADQRANVIVRDNAGNLIQFFGKFKQ